MGLSMRGWNSDHPTTAAVPEGTLRLAINLAAIPVRGDAGGLFFAIAWRHTRVFSTSSELSLLR